MHIQHTSSILAPEEQVLQFHKVIKNTIVLNATIVFESAAMLEYQKDLFVDLLSELVDTLNSEDISFGQAKTAFEQGLQDLNLKLQVFAEKMGEKSSFPIHGSMQLIYDDDYLASFIGYSGLIIVRDGRLQYMLTNKPTTQKIIDQFSETVEGEVRIGDTLITCGFDVETYLDKDDVITILGNAETESRSFLGSLVDVISTRLEEEKIRYASMIELESTIAVTQQKIKTRLDVPMKKLVEKLGGLEEFQGKILYGLIGLVTLLLLYGLFQSFFTANNDTFIVDQGESTIDINIQDVQRDIGMFETIDPSSDQKIKKYNEIVKKLDILTENDKWIDDVSKYRALLEEKYLEGFNIVSANNDGFYSNAVYEFSQTEKNTFGSPKQIFYTDSLLVAGEEGVLLNAINNEQRGSLISAGIDQSINVCGFNLLRNGLYCDTNTGMYNIVKQGFQPVTSDDGKFPSPINALDRFGNTNMYALTTDPALKSGDIFVTRYTNKPGYQDQFGLGVNYSLAQTEDMSFAGSGFTSFAIDGTFLVWSKAKKSLYQLWRPPTATTELQHRPIELNGGDTVNQYGENVKVIATPDSRYVYLFDKDNQSFTVYRSTPYKTNDKYTHEYNLQYFFSIKFGLDEFDIIDLFVQEGEQPQLYLMSEKGVYKVNLGDYMKQFAEKENS